MNSHVKAHARARTQTHAHTHTHTHTHKHWKMIIFYKHKFSYTTDFAAYTTEAWVTAQLLHQHIQMP